LSTLVNFLWKITAAVVTYKQLAFWGVLIFSPILVRLARSSRQTQDEHTLMQDFDSISGSSSSSNNNNNNTSNDISSKQRVYRLILLQHAFKDSIKPSLRSRTTLFERCIRTGMIMAHKKNCRNPECFCHDSKEIYDPSTQMSTDPESKRNHLHHLQFSINSSRFEAIFRTITFALIFIEYVPFFIYHRESL
jgi:hypothetical protein